jgi:hypothetical protein
MKLQTILRVNQWPITPHGYLLIARHRIKIRAYVYGLNFRDDVRARLHQTRPAEIGRWLAWGYGRREVWAGRCGFTTWLNTMHSAAPWHKNHQDFRRAIEVVERCTQEQLRAFLKQTQADGYGPAPLRLARLVLRLYSLPVDLPADIAEQARRIADKLDERYRWQDRFYPAWEIAHSDYRPGEDYDPAAAKPIVRRAALAVGGAVGALVAVAMLIARWVRGGSVVR